MEERWDSYYYSGSGAPGIYSGASHVRYQQEVNQLVTTESDCTYTSATERGAQSWSSSTPKELDSETEMSPPYSPLSFADLSEQVNLMCIK